MLNLLVACALLLQLVRGIEIDCPEVCVCSAIDITADCQNADLLQLPDGLHEETTRLDLSFNSFTRIPANLSRFQNLEVLILSHNQISSMDQDSFDEMEKLEVLDLSHNRFTDWRDIHAGSLMPLKSLKRFDLSHNKLRGFPAILEYPLRSDSLKTFILNNCSITNVYGDILAGMVNVERLVLSNNPLTTLNAQLKAEKLRSLDLSHCGIQRMSTDAIAELTSLESLVMSNNERLKRFNANSESLKFLELSNCSLEAYPSGDLQNLTRINLRNNQIKFISTNTLTATPKLEILSLSHNSIRTIEEGAFESVPNIKQIDLSYNTISHLDSDTFSTNTKLIRLILSHNYLSEISKLESNSLKVLDMSVCEISSVTVNGLRLMPQLEELYLSRNLINSLPNNWYAARLHTLDLSLNKISTLSNETFREMVSLRNLNLAGNRLTSSIKPEYFHDINVVRLDDNSWLCDCQSFNFRSLYDWLINKGHSSTQLRCMFPDNLAGLPWELACEEYWYTQSARSDKVWIFSVVLLVTTVVLLCVVMSIRRAYQIKENQEREMQERDRQEVRERLQRMQEQQYIARMEAAERNAPDPRETQSPPSYAEAIRMPRLDESYTSLAGSQQSLAGSQRTLSGSRYSLQSSSNDVNGKHRRKRRRSRSRIKAESIEAINDRSNERLNPEEGSSGAVPRRAHETTSCIIESDL